MEKAGIATIPVPNASNLRALTAQVDENVGYTHRLPDPMMAFLSKKIKHVIYIIKENRTYDEVLGDLPVGNGDPELALFPQAISPNHHQLALDFVTLDNFYDSGESSGVGWNWSTQGRTTEDVNAPAGDGNLAENAVGGYLWDVALRAGKTVRNYGFFIDLAYYNTSQKDPTIPDPSNPFFLPISANPYAEGKLQAAPVKPVLQDKTDLYFRSFDQNNSDVYLFNEWVRDMKQNGLPALSLLRLAHDHFGSTSTAILKLNTIQRQMSDNDYAVGKVIETISHSPAWKDTAIFIIEDDSQNGPDHIDSHRSIGYVISSYTKRGTVVSTNYNTVSMLRTIEDILGTGYVSTTDANAEPMSDVFTKTPDLTPYNAIVPGIWCQALSEAQDTTLISLCNDPKAQKTAVVPSLHNATWWAAATKGFDFSVEDKVDTDKFNRIIWAGIKGDNVPYPMVRSGADLRQNRAQLLNDWRLNSTRVSAAPTK